MLDLSKCRSARQCALAFSILVAACHTPQETAGLSPRAAAAASANDPGLARARAALQSLGRGGRLVLVGDGLVEQLRDDDTLDFALASHPRPAAALVANLGWAGDDPTGSAREGSQDALVAAVQAHKPDVVIVGYDVTASFGDAGAVPAFREKLVGLGARLEKLTRHIVVLGPTRRETVSPYLPEAEAINRSLGPVVEMLRRTAAERGWGFIDLFHLPAGPRSTVDGFHLGRDAITRIGALIAAGAGSQPGPWDVAIQLRDSGARADGVRGTVVSDLTGDAGGVSFRALDSTLPDRAASRILRIGGLAPGVYQLAVDGQPVAAAGAAEWAAGVRLAGGPEARQADALHEALGERKQLLDYRFRPFNMATVHAHFVTKSLPEFEPLIRENETRIARVRTPAAHAYQLTTGSRSASGEAHALPAPPPGAPTDADPKEELASFKVSEGFTVNLFAAEPMVVNPIQMSFDPQGRLWVACAPNYPQLYPGQKAHDSIVVLEDRDHDGRADASTAFARDLLVPTGLAPGDGGVYVGLGPNLVHFRDVDGDLKADESRVLFRGFGTQDTHHTLNSFRWGPGGDLFFHQGIFNTSHVETAAGLLDMPRGGVWRLRPRHLELAIHDLTPAESNTWGHAFDQWGQQLVTNAWVDGIEALEPPLGLRNESRMVSFLRVGGARHCGADIVDGRHLPPDWQGNLLSGQFVKQQVNRFALQDGGTLPAGEELPPLIASAFRAFRPIDVKQGPDGAIYIADLYTPIIQHNQINFADPRRDHTHGRIWRVQRTDRALLRTPNLHRLETPELVTHLGDEESWTRSQTRRELAERDRTAVLPAVCGFIAHIDPKDPRADLNRLEALWVYEHFDEVREDLVETLAASPRFEARAAALRHVRRWHEKIRQSLALTRGHVADEHPKVRLQALLALGQLGTTDAMRAALRALERPTDRVLEVALQDTIKRLQPAWYPEFLAGRFDFGDHWAELALALRMADDPRSAPKVRAMLAIAPGTRGMTAAGHHKLLELLASLGDPGDLRVVFDEALREPSPEAQGELLTALGGAATGRKVVPAGDLDGLAALARSSDESVQEAALRLGGAWQVKALGPVAAAIAGSSRTPAPVRDAAIAVIAGAAGPDARAALLAFTGDSHPAPVRIAAAVALAPLDLAKAAAAAAEILGRNVPPDVDAAPLFWVFLKRKGGTDALVRALEKKPPALDMAKVGLRVANTAGATSKELSRVLGASAGDALALAAPSPAALKELVAETRDKGDPARGETVFRRAELSCLNCHAIEGMGNNVGPDLAALGRTAPVDYIIESLLDPPKAVKDGYESVLVLTHDGASYNGIRVRKTKEALVLKDATSDAITVPLGSIQSVKPSGSLMPSGLTALLTHGEFLDLVRFLAALGKAPEFSVGPTPLVRSWQMLPTPPRGFGTLDAKALGSVLATDGRLKWKRVYGRVCGDLPIADALPAPGAPDGYLRFKMEVTKPGWVALDLDQPQGINAWIDGRPVGPNLSMELGRGTHTVYLKVHADRKKALRCALKTGSTRAAPSAAKARLLRAEP